MLTMSIDLPQLPACSKCRVRKVRCDRQAPKCGNCTKGNAACIIVDLITGDQHARDYIQRLEEEEASLKVQLNTRTPHDALQSDQAEQVPRGPLTSETVVSHSGFVGDGSGLGFLHHILSEGKWQHHRARVLDQLADRPRISKQSITPHEFPTLSEAEQLLENYFTRFHIHHTFLLRQEVLNIFYKLYGQSPPSDAIIPIVDAPDVQDRFRLLMVFAISATTRYRAGLCTQHPYGYYLAAESCLTSIPLIQGTEALQNLLLIARFGMYHHIGCSLWEISQVCMRQCIELGLHKQPSKPLEPLKEQHFRRIFWECYILDRYSSGILGRPFAIAEADITVLLPVNAYDDHIATHLSEKLDSMYQIGGTGITEMSIFIVFIELRRISSRIHTTFYTRRPTMPSTDRHGMGTHSMGHVYVTFVHFKSELDAWRLTIPTFGNPRSLYERSDWHDFMYHKDMLLLTRGALHSLPTPLVLASSSAVDLVSACYMSAARVIQLYADLMDKRAITWTRSYFQVIFTAGLTVTYCISLGMLAHISHDPQAQNDAIETITRCARVLSHFKEQMPDAGSFAVVFELLKDECINGILGSSATSLTHEAINESGATDASLSVPLQTTEGLNGSWTYTGVETLESNIFGTDFGLTDDLMTQLEAGMGEYAWGSLPLDGDVWDQFSFA
ncbi:fungal-specific transcription factor domain-containing protein [Boeremia exigua]|uniref:fungal-specific transcription factor domain-containing protein n=1 Tax=Boeremia exigua TaxID=749465 RepID=UPI001E8C9E04|nr:fungal-specific transcription factor domain-containing protein [Boeremia exigua]KAH6639837.1 fungal-specific transcription factor domain-containing protein [Boeremia exigua]